MKVFELLPRPLGNIFRKLTHLTCNSPLLIHQCRTGGKMPPVPFVHEAINYFIIAAATFLNALTSASMCSSVYVGCVQKEIVASAREFAISQLNFV